MLQRIVLQAVTFCHWGQDSLYQSGGRRVPTDAEDPFEVFLISLNSSQISTLSRSQETQREKTCTLWLTEFQIRWNKSVSKWMLGKNNQTLHCMWSVFCFLCVCVCLSRTHSVSLCVCLQLQLWGTWCQIWQVSGKQLCKLSLRVQLCSEGDGEFIEDWCSSRCRH